MTGSMAWDAAVSWQDGVVLLAALLAGGWLIRRWLMKRRARAGCDRCAAAVLAATHRPRERERSAR